MNRPRFALRLIGYVGPVQELIRLSVLAEQAGFDSVWYPHDTFMHNTWVITSAVATQTSSIEIGSVGTNPYTTDPCEVATYLATLDELSRGRAILGLGLHTTEMIGWAGVVADDYITRTREATDIIRALFRGETVNYQGKEFHWSDQCYFRLTPVRSEVPIYISAFGDEYLALGGAIGDGCLPMLTPPESAGHMVSMIEAGSSENERYPDNYVISGCAWLSLSEKEQAAADVMTKMVAYFGPYLEDTALNTVGLSVEQMLPMKDLISNGNYDAAYDLVTDDMLQIGITGTPNQVIARIENIFAAGVTEINLGGPLGPDPEQAIRIMGENVIPYFR